jgi:hypothetical protein
MRFKAVSLARANQTSSQRRSRLPSEARGVLAALFWYGQVNKLIDGLRHIYLRPVGRQRGMPPVVMPWSASGTPRASPMMLRAREHSDNYECGPETRRQVPSAKIQPYQITTLLLTIGAVAAGWQPTRLRGGFLNATQSAAWRACSSRHLPNAQIGRPFAARKPAGGRRTSSVCRVGGSFLLWKDVRGGKSDAR